MSKPRVDARSQVLVSLVPQEDMALQDCADALRLPKTQTARLAVRALSRFSSPDALSALNLQATQQKVPLDDYESFILSHLDNPLSLLPQDTASKLKARAERKGVSALAELLTILDAELNRGKKKPRKETPPPQVNGHAAPDYPALEDSAEELIEDA